MRLGGFAAAFAFAAILAFATHVSGLAAPLPFATVQSFAIMFGGGGVRGFGACGPTVVVCAACAHGSDNQSGHGGRDNHCSGGSCHIFDRLNCCCYVDWPPNGRFKKQIPATPFQLPLYAHGLDAQVYIALPKKQGPRL
jgi:hypothetical protein